MEIEVVRQVNSRWHDGRTFSAMPGRLVSVDTADKDLVVHMRYLIATGDVVEVEPEPELEVVSKIVKPADVEAEAEVPTNEELREDLRERGLPVSGNKDELIERLADDDAEQAAVTKPAKKSTKAAE